MPWSLDDPWSLWSLDDPWSLWSLDDVWSVGDLWSVDNEDEVASAMTDS